MGFFAGRNVADISSNPNELPNNTYVFQVTSAKYAPTKNGDKNGITFKYQIVEGPWSRFWPLTDWVEMESDNSTPEQVETFLSYLKMRLVGFGLSDAEMEEISPDNLEETLVGKRFHGTTAQKKNKNGETQPRIVKFDVIEDDDDPWGSNDTKDDDGDSPF